MAENIDNNGCLQRDSAEHEGYAKALRSFNRIKRYYQPTLTEYMALVIDNMALSLMKSEKMVNV